MKSMKAWAIGLGVLAAFCAACSPSDDDNEPPPTGTKYYAYICSALDDTVFGYSINMTTGGWTAVPGSPFAAGGWPRSVAVDPRGKFVCVANNTSSDISIYAITATTGALSEISGSPFDTRFYPAGLAFDRSGRFLYVMHLGDKVSAYSVNSTTGVLTEMAGSPYSTGTQAGNSDIMVDPHGYYLLYISTYDLGVFGYTADFDTGALSPVPGSPFQAPLSTKAWDLAMDTQSKFLYACFESGITLFWIDWASGHLAFHSSWLPAPDGPARVAVDPTGKYVYAIDQNWDRVFGYMIDAQTGALTGIFNSPFASGDCPVAIAFDPEGKFAYVTNMDSGNVSAYAIEPATGVLTPLGGSPLPVTTGIVDIAIVKITY